MKKSILFTLTIFFGVLFSQGQDLVKVKETNTVPGGNGYPASLTPCNGKLFFTANDNTGYASLWVTGGTDATTLQLRAPTPGLTTDRLLVSYKNKLYFLGDDGINGPEVWTSDGTVAGTVLFKDVYPGSSGSYPQSFTVANNKLFFYTYDLGGLKKLYVTDGTAGGTIQLKTGIQDFNGYTSFAILNNNIYFTGDDGTGSGYGLWKSDGTLGGTSFVSKDLTPGVSGGNYAVLNNKLYFSGFDNTNGSELWVTDGSNAGTHIVMNLAPDAGGVLYSGSPHNMVVYNGKIYFAGNDQVHGNELFVTDGVTIQLVKDVLVGTDGSRPVPIVFNGLLYIIYSQLFELWKSDGTAGGTQLVKSIAPYSKFAGVWNSKLYMTNDFDYSVWESDGTAAGTGLVKVQNTNNQIFSYGSDQTFVQFNGDLYFAGQCGGITGGYELVKLTLGGAAVTSFSFTGSGNWSNPANWAGGIVPPSTLPSGYSVVIDGNCTLDVAVVFQSGASLTVKAGKSLVILGSLIVL